MARKFDITKVSFLDLFHQRVADVPSTLTSYSDNVLYLKGIHDGMLPFCNSSTDIEDLDFAYTSHLKSLFSGDHNE